MTEERLHKPRVCFIFRSKANRGIGGAERSMQRLMQYAHPHMLDCSVILDSSANKPLSDMYRSIDIPVYVASAPFELYHTLMRLQPDIVYLFARIHVGAIWATVAHWAKVPMVIVAERGWGGGLVDFMSQRLSRLFVNGYIANSQAAAHHLARAGVQQERTFVVYNGIPELQAPQSDQRIQQPLGSPSLICVANILPLKGQRILLEAVVKLRQYYPNALAVLVGRDYTKGKFFDSVQRAGLADTYMYVGFTNDVFPYLQRADVFVLPSLWGEGMPTSLLEAMLAGKPVVASRTGGIIELVENEKTGLLVPPGDADALAAQIRRILDDIRWGEQLGIAARDHVVAQHSITSMVEGHIKAFQYFISSAR